MALANKIGNLFKKVTTSNLSVYQAVRCMSSSKVFVGGLSYGTDDQSLREAFTNFGEVVQARVIIDRETGRSRGFGFVTFTSEEEASSAISGMDRKDLHGRMIRVDYATERTGFRGGFGGGAGGYSGGGSYGGGSYGGGSYGGGDGGYGGAGRYSSGGGFGGGNSVGYGGNTGGYGGSSGGEGYSVAGGGGGSDNYVGGASGDNYVSGGAAAGVHGGSSATDYGCSGSQDSNNMSSADAGYENVSQEDLLDGNFKDDDDELLDGNFKDDDDDDESDSYANKQS